MNKREVTTNCIHPTAGGTTPVGEGRVVITVQARLQF